MTLSTDASDVGWGASLKMADWQMGACAQPWEGDNAQKHITHREALASALGAKALLHLIPPGARLQLQADASSTVFAWRKGSKIPAINNPILQAHCMLAAQKILVEANHIQGTKNKRADWLSRNPDPKSYRLDPHIFKWVCQELGEHPTVDLFATRQNR